MKKNYEYYQQGDVLLKKIAELPTDLEKLDDLVLQHGETTGHMHQFDKGSPVTVYRSKHDRVIKANNTDTITPNESKYIMVENVAYLRHEEHKPIAVPPGIYEIDIVREFDYEEMEMRRVID